MVTDIMIRGVFSFHMKDNWGVQVKPMNESIGFRIERVDYGVSHVSFVRIEGFTWCNEQTMKTETTEGGITTVTDKKKKGAEKRRAEALFRGLEVIPNQNMFTVFAVQRTVQLGLHAQRFICIAGVDYEIVLTDQQVPKELKTKVAGLTAQLQSTILINDLQKGDDEPRIVPELPNVVEEEEEEEVVPM